MIGSLFNIPHFLKEKTPLKLQESMFANNSKEGKEFKYFDIVYVNGFWYAWYYYNIEKTILKGGE